MKRLSVYLTIVGIVIVMVEQTAFGSKLYTFSVPGGLSAEAEFTLLDSGNILQVRLKNTSTGVPDGFSSADQILTGVSWDFGHPGYNGDAMITGGTVVTGPSSQSLEFDKIGVGPNADVSGEYGYGNEDGTGLLTNFITAEKAQAIEFGGTNLDGPGNIDGPQGGLVSNPLIDPPGLGGLGAIQDEIIATLTLSEPLTDLGFLDANMVRIEWGSDAMFQTVVPEPTTITLLLCELASLALLKRRR